MHCGCKVGFVGTPFGYGKSRATERMFANECAGGKRNEALCRECIGKLKQGIVEIAVSIEYHGHYWCLMSFEKAEPFEGYGGNATAIDRDSHDGQLVFNLFFRVECAAGDVCLVIGSNPHSFDDGMSYTRRSVCRGEVNNMDVFKAHK